MKKKFPILKSDKEAEAFLEQDLTDYITAENMVPVNFEFTAKTEQINMRLPKPLLAAVKSLAAKKHMPYQRFIRAVLQSVVTNAAR